MRLTPLVSLIFYLLAAVLVWGQDSERRYICDIEVVGNKNVSKGIILANFELKKGDRYSQKGVQESLRSLYGLGLFSDLSLEDKASQETKRGLVTLLGTPSFTALGFAS